MDNAELTTESENLLTKTRKSVSLAENVVILNDSARASSSSEKSGQRVTDNGPSSSNTSSKKGSRKAGSKRNVRRSTKSVHSIPSKNNNKVIKSTHRTSRPSTRNVSASTRIETEDRSTYIDALSITNQNDSRLLTSASSISIFEKNIWSQSSQEEKDSCSTQSKERSDKKITCDEVTDYSNERRPSNLSFIHNVFKKLKDENIQTQNAQNKIKLNKENVSNFKKRMLRFFKSTGSSRTRNQANSIIFYQPNKDSQGIDTRTKNYYVPVKTLYTNEKSVKEEEQLMYDLLNAVDNEQNFSSSYNNDAFKYIVRKERTWLAETSAADKDQSNKKNKTVSPKPLLKVPLDFLENRNKGYEKVSTETRSGNKELAGIKSNSIQNNRIASQKRSLGSVFKKVSISSKKGSEITDNAKISGENYASKYHDQSNPHSNMSQNEISVIDEGVDNNSKYQESGKIFETKILGKLFATPDSKSGKRSKNKFISGLYPRSRILEDISNVEEKSEIKCQQQFIEEIIIKPPSEKEISNQNEKFLHETKSPPSDHSNERLQKYKNVEICKNESFVFILTKETPTRNFDLSKTDSAALNFENLSTYTVPIENPVSKNIEIQENLESNDLSNLSGPKRLKNTSTNRSKYSLKALISRHSKSSKKSSDNNVHDKRTKEKKLQIATEQVSHIAYKDTTKLPELMTRNKREWIKNSTEIVQNNKPSISTKYSVQTFKKTSSLLSRIFHSNRSAGKQIYNNCSNSHYPVPTAIDTIMASNIVTLGENITLNSYNVNHLTVNDAASTSKVFFDKNSVTQQLEGHLKSAELKNVNQDGYVEKPTASIFKRRSSLIMTVIPSSGKTTNPVTVDSSEQCYYFYYLLGPPLDVALVDIVTVLKQLIDKISNSQTDRPR